MFFFQNSVWGQKSLERTSGIHDTKNILTPVPVTQEFFFLHGCSTNQGPDVGSINLLHKPRSEILAFYIFWFQGS